jgi:hypothetical protein
LGHWQQGARRNPVAAGTHDVRQMTGVLMGSFVLAGARDGHHAGGARR